MNEISPGDPAAMIAGDAASVEVVEQIREDLGLNKPLPVRFFNYTKNLVLHGDLAHPIRQNVLFWMKLWIGCYNHTFVINQRGICGAPLHSDWNYLCHQTEHLD
mgnify:CR=1 FL=1